MAIVAGCDEAYAPHFAALLHSLAIHCKGQKVWFLDCGLKDSTQESLLQFASRLGMDLEWFRVDPNALSGLPALGRQSFATYARILIPDLLPGDLRQVLYLDVDCIVTDDLSPLLEIDLGSFLLAGVRDPAARKSEPIDISDYINSGVMLFNLQAWRREGIALKTVEYARQHSVKFVDQTAINVVAAGRKLLIDSRWNLMTTYATRTDWREQVPVSAPAVVHYNGGVKPWLYSDVPLGEIYRVHRRATPFPLPPLFRERNPFRVALYVALRRKRYLQRHQFNQHFRQSFVAPYLAKVLSL